MMRPPSEWLDDYDEWYAMQTKEVQEELRDVPRESIVWQVDGNLYGRQSAAAQYRDRLEEIITNKLPKEKYNFQRGKLDACVYRCTKTETVLIHHIDDFDIAGREEILKDLLTVQFPANGCKLKMGEFEYPNGHKTSTSEFLGRMKINTDGAIVTKPSDRHIETILRHLGMEDCKPSPVPGRKLDLTQTKELNEDEKAVFASCVGSAIYLSQDRSDIKYSVKELAKQIRSPRQCDWQNLKVLARYLQGTRNYGHMSKISEEVDVNEALPLHAFCDSDWAGDRESRKSTSGEVLFLAGTAVEATSHTQQGVPATSSGEAELRSLNECARSSVYVRNLATHDFGLNVDTPRIWCDSAAALQVSRKMGVGKMRHVDIGHLYVQELVKTRQVIVGKTDGKLNPSDILTKHLDTGDMVKQGVERLGIVDLSQEGLDRNVGKAHMKTIGGINNKTENPGGNKSHKRKWQPQQGSRISIRQHFSAVASVKSLRVTPDDGVGDVSYKHGYYRY